ncbi:MAG TPA: lytic transglycosylase domain-containing protein, partial [Thermoanaerobaculia bacterium]
MISRGTRSAPPAPRRTTSSPPAPLGILLLLLAIGLLSGRVASAQALTPSDADPSADCNVVDDALLGIAPLAPLAPTTEPLGLPGEALPPGLFVGPPQPPLDFEPFPRPSVMPPLSFSKALGVPKTPYGKQIYKVALRHSLNPQLLAAVIERESAFNARARSSKGAFGLMQLLPSTARRFGLRRRAILNPAKNLEAGARYLKWLAERVEGDTLLVLAAYNAGEGSVERFGGVPPFRETRDYVTRIFARLGIDLF